MHQLTNIVNNHGLIGTDELLNIINDARHDRDETIIRNNDFIARVKDELEGDNYESFVVQNLNKTESVILRISTDQAMLVAMRESKAVRRIVLEKLKQRQPPFLPQSLPEALRLAADLAEEKLQLENQLAIAAPKAEFADRVGEAAGVLIGNYAKTVGIGPNKLFAWMRDNGVLIASGSRRNIPMQEYMDRGYFTIKETPIDTNHGVEISFTTKITGKGQQWITTKLLSAGILKAVGSAA